MKETGWKVRFHNEVDWWSYYSRTPIYAPSVWLHEALRANYALYPKYRVTY